MALESDLMAAYVLRAEALQAMGMADKAQAVLSVRFQPMAPFQVRPVTRHDSDMPGHEDKESPELSEPATKCHESTT